MASKKIAKVLKYTAVFEPAEEGGYVVSVPALPGCMSQGETFEEAVRMIKDAISGYLFVLKKQGEEIPRESHEKSYLYPRVHIFTKEEKIQDHCSRT